jgi:hypothetical protein
MYRHDNRPHLQWQGVASFPKPFHAERRLHGAASTLADDQSLRFANFSRLPLVRFLLAPREN